MSVEGKLRPAMNGEPVIDLRRKREIETDDAWYLKVHRGAMTIDWYREMPRTLEFCDRDDPDKIEV